jgi:adenylosuccinate synthase
MHARVVIGANFGDEGKGKLTSAYAKDWADIVVRYNSGAQAAHTVMDKNGFRHVFGHVGSGAHLNIPTYLSKYFVVNPTLFLREWDTLQSTNKKGFIGHVFVDNRCRISTVYDVLINQMLERKRDKSNHGSCGVGFHETVVRSNTKYAIHVNDIVTLSKERLFKHIADIRDNYIIPRVKELQLEAFLSPQMKHVLTANSTIEILIEQFYTFLNTVSVVGYNNFLERFKNVVFEGAQGLLLDEHHAWFPYVTHSKTGLYNVFELLKEAGVFTSHYSIDVTYVSRCYLTRHGVGPFLTERQKLSEFDVVDKTNVHNEFQGSLRLGYLHIDLLLDTIKKDLRVATVPVNTKLHFTCLDQIKEKYVFAYGPIENYKTFITDYAEDLLKDQVATLTKDVSFSYSPYLEDVNVYNSVTQQSKLNEYCT